MKGDEVTRAGLQRIFSLGSGELHDGQFWKLLEILASDERLAKIDLTREDLRRILWDRYGVRADVWNPPGWNEDFVELVLPAVEGKGRLFLRIMRPDFVSLYDVPHGSDPVDVMKVTREPFAQGSPAWDTTTVPMRGPGRAQSHRCNPTRGDDVFLTREEGNPRWTLRVRDQLLCVTHCPFCGTKLPT